MPDVVRLCVLYKGYTVSRSGRRLSVYAVQGLLRHAMLNVARWCVQSKGYNRVQNLMSFDYV